MGTKQGGNGGGGGRSSVSWLAVIATAAVTSLVTQVVQESAAPGIERVRAFIGYDHTVQVHVFEARSQRPLEGARVAIYEAVRNPADGPLAAGETGRDGISELTIKTGSRSHQVSGTYVDGEIVYATMLPANITADQNIKLPYDGRKWWAESDRSVEISSLAPGASREVVGEADKPHEHPQALASPTANRSLNDAVIEAAVRAPGYMATALAEVGVEEDADADRVRSYWGAFPRFAARVDDPHDWPWNVTFVAWVLGNHGISVVDSPRSLDWLDWGQPAGALEPGCIAYFERDNGVSQSFSMGFFLFEADERMFAIAGNVGNKVAIRAFDKSTFTACRVPKA